MKLLNFTIIKLIFFLIIGIGLAHYVEIPLNYSVYATFTLLFLLIISYLIALKQFFKTFWFGLFSFMLTMAIGSLTVNLHNQKHFTNHYTQSISPKNIKPKTITFRIRDVLKPGYYHKKYIIDVLKVEGESVSGKLLLNVEIDTIFPRLKVDEIYVTKTSIQELNPALNPNQFDYKDYLEKQYVYHQLYIDGTSLLKVSSNKHTLFGFASRLHETINLKLEASNFKPDELAIINALLLGQRQDIDKEIYDNYTNAGAVHILAVSGLHVGIIFIMLSFLFKPLERFKYGTVVKALLILGMLWSFAIIAGLSASVTRAVSMFSIVAIGMHLKRPANIYNTLAISMFILLLCKPMFLFDVGFQLSYAAVFGIVSIYPLLYKLWKPPLKIMDKFWQVFVVGIAAQIGVVPISLFYFHQFPGLFFISNLVIIPALGLILGFGIIVILIALLNILPNFIAEIYGNIISLMNDLVSWVSHQEQFLIKDISFGVLYVIVTYIFIISMVKCYQKQNYKNIRFLLFAILLVQTAMIYNHYESSTNKFTVLHKSRFSLIAEKTNTTLHVTHNFDSITKAKDRTIRNYEVGNFVNVTTEDYLKSIYKLKGEMLLIIDSLGIYNVKSFQPDYVLLRNSPKVNLNRMIDSINPKIIIADGSNYKSYIKRWEQTCLKRKLPFHQTGKKGAFVIEYAK